MKEISTDKAEYRSTIVIFIFLLFSEINLCKTLWFTTKEREKKEGIFTIKMLSIPNLHI